ncbi:hypothetical protein S1OALGB6SA_992, partial [Olavius algarvensis spirochete endosymbiont]|uniref:hypothetical protein n=1 Tax=Olavius algarvensis spirochete endosymbiont TaxID=260710 RepID=UPI000F1ED914
FRNWFTAPNRGPEIEHPPSHNEESTVATSNTQDIFTAEAESDKGNDWLEAARELKRLEASIKPFPVDEVTGDPYFDYSNEPFTSSDG